MAASKVPQTGWWLRTEATLSWVWRPYNQNQGLHRDPPGTGEDHSWLLVVICTSSNEVCGFLWLPVAFGGSPWLWHWGTLWRAEIQ